MSGIMKSLTGLALMAVVSPAVWAQQEGPVAPGAAPKVEVSETEWDFGTVWQGEKVSKKITIKNVGEAPLTLNVRSSCGCTVPTKPKSPLGPGESDTFEISYNTLKRKGKARQSVTVTTNDPAKPTVQIRVMGDVKEMVELLAVNPDTGKTTAQDAVYLGQLYEDTKKTMVMRLRPVFTEALELRLKPDQDFSPFVVEFKEVEKGKEYELSVSTNPPISLDQQRQFSNKNIAIETGREGMEPIKVRVHAIVLPSVHVRPTQLYVPRAIRSQLKRIVRVSYRPDKPIKILSATSDLPGVEVRVDDSPPKVPNAQIAYHTIHVTLPASNDVPKDGGKITIQTDSNDERYKEFSVPVRVVASGRDRFGNRTKTPSVQGSNRKSTPNKEAEIDIRTNSDDGNE